MSSHLSVRALTKLIKALVLSVFVSKGLCIIYSALCCLGEGISLTLPGSGHGTESGQNLGDVFDVHVISSKFVCNWKYLHRSATLPMARAKVHTLLPKFIRKVKYFRSFLCDPKRRLPCTVINIVSSYSRVLGSQFRLPCAALRLVRGTRTGSSLCAPLCSPLLLFPGRKRQCAFLGSGCI